MAVIFFSRSRTADFHRPHRLRPPPSALRPLPSDLRPPPLPSAIARQGASPPHISISTIFFLLLTPIRLFHSDRIERSVWFLRHREFPFDCGGRKSATRQIRGELTGTKCFFAPRFSANKSQCSQKVTVSTFLPFNFEFVSDFAFRASDLNHASAPLVSKSTTPISQFCDATGGHPPVGAVRRCVGASVRQKKQQNTRSFRKRRMDENSR